MVGDLEMSNEEKDYDIFWSRTLADGTLVPRGLNHIRLQEIINELVKRIEVLEGKDD